MSNLTRKLMMGAAGAAGGDPVYIDDVFNIYLHKGTATSKTIPTGIDLATEGGLYWTKKRTGGTSNTFFNNWLYDTERTGNNAGLLRFDSDTDNAVITPYDPSFTTTGVNLTNYAPLNDSGGDYVSWTFRKAPGFFDIVTWNGASLPADNMVAHNLGSAPGMIICKNLAAGNNWKIYHRSATSSSSTNPNFHFLELPLNNGTTYSSGMENDTDRDWAVSSTHFRATGSLALGNGSDDFVAYLFAHDEASFGTDGDESIIKCGKWTASGGAASIDLGFEPQFVLIKNSTDAGAWFLFDNMRGMSVGGNDSYLRVDAAATENSGSNFIEPTPTGFDVLNLGSSQEFIYMAIRRPNKPPTVATEVFNPIFADTPRTVAQRPEKVDMYWFTKTGAWGENIQISDRVRGFQSVSSGGDDSHTSPWLITNDINAEGVTSGAICQENNSSAGPFVIGVSAGSSFMNYIFKRAPGFFDIVAYSGTGANQAVNHNLEVTPEFVIIKQRSSGSLTDWICWHKDLTNTNPYIFLNQPAGEGPYGAAWFTPSSTAFNLSSTNYINNSSKDYIAYLFASLSGISYVGSYDGDTNTAFDVDCGFTNGARFILIKRTNGTGDWFLWDSSRGIGAGIEPYLRLNETSGQTPTANYIDQHSENKGFRVTASAPTVLNETGGTYLFLAIA